MLNLNWRKCVGDVWCSFGRLNIQHEEFNNAIGVYIIWSGKITIKVGSGVIREEIEKDRHNLEIVAYNDARISWSEVSNNNINGVKKYLIRNLSPTVSGEPIMQNEIEVNFPW